MKRRNILLWHSFEPFSHEEYGCVKYTFSISSSCEARSANSEPLSLVDGLANLVLPFAKIFNDCFQCSLEGFGCVIFALIQRDIRIMRSANVRTQGSPSSFLLTTISASQSMNSVRISTISGHSSMLVPKFHLFSQDFFALVLRRSCSG